MLAKNLGVQSRGTRLGHINSLAIVATISARNIHLTATPRNVSNIHSVDSFTASAYVMPAKIDSLASPALSWQPARTLDSGTPPVV